MKSHILLSTELKNGKELIIRRGLRKDIDSVWEIFNIIIKERKFLPVFTPVKSEFEKQSWYLRMREQQNMLLVAVVEGRVVGQLTIEHIDWDASSHVGELGIIILPQYRNMGIGTKLIQRAIDIVKEKNLFKKICLSCFHNNYMALNVYKNLEFEEVGRKKKQFFIDGKWLDEIILERIIDETPPD
ncbi:MAG: GNAT family N-acetyltransferase [Candidatus Lokiarchaeota archaeon]|nr:GNAT family N-acetyltransferase [Candidatus Lokiarchaeota archaeon]